MREILFRGKSIITNKWACGDLFQHGEQKFIMHDGVNVEVNPETVGEYAGLTDKGGVKIFEGDVIQCETAVGTVAYQTGAGENFVSGFVVLWTNKYYLRQELGFWATKRDITVIGNVYDNPELVGGDDNAAD